MTTILEQMTDDVKTAMKAGDRDKVTALRLVVNEIQKAIKDGRDVDEVALLRRERKRRMESVDMYETAGRGEAAAAERREAELIESYLPTELDDEALAELVSAAITETGASGPKDMGSVMKHVMAAAGGQADGKRVSALVRAQLVS